jgi:hypothetical protein
MRELVRGSLAYPLDRAHLTDRPGIHARALPALLVQATQGAFEEAGCRHELTGYGERILLVVALLGSALIPAHRHELRRVLALRQQDPVPLEPQDIAYVTAVLKR